MYFQHMDKFESYALFLESYADSKFKTLNTNQTYQRLNIICHGSHDGLSVGTNIFTWKNEREENNFKTESISKMNKCNDKTKVIFKKY